MSLRSRKKFKCSCGRSFSKESVLERHQRKKGCKPAGEEGAPGAEKSEPTSASPTPAVAQAASNVPSAAQKSVPVMDPSAVVAPSPVTVPAAPVVPARPKRPKTEILKEFTAFLAHSAKEAFGLARTTTTVLMRVALFTAVVAGVGWFLASNTSPVDAQVINQRQSETMAARVVVDTFLQNAQLNQVQRARDLLAPSLRTRVTDAQLERLFQSLPVSQRPESCVCNLDPQSGRAVVVIRRNGGDEVYTLEHGRQGWGLTDVSLKNA